MANTPTSPKVKAAGAVGSIVGILLAYAAAVTPETFAFLGVWAQPAYLAVTLGSALYAAYQTRDPLRKEPADPAPAASPAEPATAPHDAPAEVTPIIPA